MKQMFLVLAIGWATGCSTVKSYDGPAMPAEKVARLEGSTYFWGIASQTMGLCEVDGKRLVNKDDDSETPQYAVEVLPGEHEISICYSRSNASRTVRSPFDRKINLKVEAGHTYKIDFETKIKIILWVTDEKTGVRVWEGETFPPFPMRRG